MDINGYYLQRFYSKHMLTTPSCTKAVIYSLLYKFFKIAFLEDTGTFLVCDFTKKMALHGRCFSEYFKKFFSIAFLYKVSFR